MKRIILLLFISLNVFSQKTPYDLYKQNDYDLAIELFNKGNYKSASNIFYELSQDEIMKSNGKDISSRYYYSLCEIYTGQKNSDKILDKFLEENNNEVNENETYYLVGKKFFTDLNFIEAEKWYSKVDKFEIIKDKKYDYLFELGFSQYKNVNYEGAKPNLYMASKSSNYREKAIYYYSHIAYSEKMYVTSLEEFEKIKKGKKYIEIIPKYEISMLFLLRKYKDAIKIGLEEIKDSTKNNTEIYKVLGDCYFQLGNYTNACKYYEKGKSGKFSNKEYYKIGYSYYSEENYTKAINNLNKIINVNSKMSQSAYYYLADSYLSEGKKVEAFNAFKKTSEMKFDTIIQKDALYNYIKLSYELGNPYEEVIKVIDAYNKKYPNDIFLQELNNIKIGSLINSGKYDKILKNGEEINYNSHKIQELIQYASFKKAMKNITLEKYKEALPYLSKVIEYNRNIELRNRAIFWRGECFYKLDSSEKAILDFKDFSLSSDLENYYEEKYLSYNLGYVYFNLKDYHQSLFYLTKYINSQDKDNFNKDAILRIADCNLAIGEYNLALENYKKYSTYQTKEYQDYAQFNIAIYYGLLGQINKKIEKLNYITKQFPKSYLNSGVLYELGMSYIRNNNTQSAISSFDTLEVNHPYSDYVIKSKLKKALIYYNQNDKNKSISIYKNIVENYYGSIEAIEAMRRLKKIYVEDGELDKFISYSEEQDFVDFTNEELDSLSFIDAEKLYLAKNYTQAVERFNDYRKRFHKGIFLPEVLFYNAESLFFLDDKEEAKILYEKILEQENYTEYFGKSSFRLINIYGEKGDLPNLLKALNKLLENTSDPKTIEYTEKELAKAYYRDENFTESFKFSNKVINSYKKNLTTKEKNSISLILARSSVEINNDSIARREYLYLTENTIEEELAESMYYNAYFLYKDKNYDSVINIVSKMGEEVPEYKFWGGKGLILMAKSFYYLEDKTQTNFILENVIINIPFKEVQDEATEFLEFIKTEQGKTKVDILSLNDNKHLEVIDSTKNKKVIDTTSIKKITPTPLEEKNKLENAE